MYILAIETSCDDTSISILKDNQVLSCITKVNLEKFNAFGGIVPEIAARFHEQNILKATNEALSEAKIDLKQINLVAYTKNPGLVNCLFVGEIFAKTLANLLNVECLPLNHIEGHILSPFINSMPDYPFLSLIASGKTTSIFLVNSVNDIQELSKTVDDAIGETFDKIGKKLGYPYPGGPNIDKHFDINKATIDFSIKNDSNNFSFSGIKNKVFTYINKQGDELENKRIEIGSSFMKTAIDLIVKKLEKYSKQYSCKTICIGGGVASNSYFKQEIAKTFVNNYIPKKEYATDNAAMIGYLAYLKKN